MNGVWWVVSGFGGLVGYVGGSTGVEVRRHAEWCAPGRWLVGITGWQGPQPAVVDDFGNLVQVPA